MQRYLNRIKAELVLRRRVFAGRCRAGERLSESWSLPFGPSSGEVSVATASALRYKRM
jgi:hypothetical protein